MHLLLGHSDLTAIYLHVTERHLKATDTLIDSFELVSPTARPGEAFPQTALQIKQPPFEVADTSFVQQQTVDAEESMPIKVRHLVLRAIQCCRRAVLGGRVDQSVISYNPYRHRHRRRRQTNGRRQWLASGEQERALRHATVRPRSSRDCLERSHPAIRIPGICCLRSLHILPNYRGRIHIP